MKTSQLLKKQKEDFKNQIIFAINSLRDEVAKKVGLDFDGFMLLANPIYTFDVSQTLLGITHIHTSDSLFGTETNSTVKFSQLSTDTLINVLEEMEKIENYSFVD